MAWTGVVGAAVRRTEGVDWLDDRGPELLPFPRLRRLRRRGGACPELDCIRHLLPHRIIAAAERRAISIGVGAERVLICADAITEEAYLQALAASLGRSYEYFDDVSRGDCPLDDDQLIDAAAAGLLPLRHGNEIAWIIAPRGLTARHLADPGERWPQSLQSFRLTSDDRLRHFVTRHCQRTIGKRATDTLRRTWPLFSNAPPPRRRRVIGAALAVLSGFTLFSIVPIAMIEASGGLLCMAFLAASILRLLTACFGHEPAQNAAMEDGQLPIYTVICALYRESAVVDGLVAAIRALDYPPEKLDVKLVLEADDPETRAALLRLNLGPPFEIVIAPPHGPRTKPKALNVALPFARGTFTVIYDAEDRPQPDQLRRALAAFRRGGSRLACVQASLTIDNAADNWLVRMFAANYAGQFDVFLPGLAGLHLPFPLGGSSNHFRTMLLRKLGGWDPYNVTEDADLGIRLYRLGYRSTTVSSATYEEAPTSFVQWLKQRTRWYKGWMQTWRVHMRRPTRLWQDLNPAGAIAFQIFFAGNALSALIHPFFMAGLGYTIYALPAPWAYVVLENAVPIFLVSLCTAYLSTVALDVAGLWRRKLLRHAWILILIPLHWFLLSLAAWRALFQLIYDPQRWEKTEHGLAKNLRPSEVPAARSRHRQTLIDVRRNKLRIEAAHMATKVHTATKVHLATKVKIGPATPIAPLKLMQARPDAMPASFLVGGLRHI